MHNGPLLANLFLFKFIVSKQIQPLLNFIRAQTFSPTFNLVKNFLKGHVFLQEAIMKLSKQALRLKLPE